MSIFSMFEDRAYYKRDEGGDYRPYDVSHITSLDYEPVDEFERFIMRGLSDVDS